MCVLPSFFRHIHNNKETHFPGVLFFRLFCLGTVSIPSISDLLELGGSWGSAKKADRDPITVHLESIEVDQMPFTQIMPKEDVLAILNGLPGFKKAKAAELHEHAQGTTGVDFAEMLSAAISSLTPVNIEHDDVQGNVTCGTMCTRLEVGALDESKGAVSDALTEMSKKRKAFGLKRRLMDSITVKVDKLRLNKLVPTDGMRDNMRTGGGVHHHTVEVDIVCDELPSIKPRAERSGAAAEVIELSGVKIENADMNWKSGAGLDLFTSDAVVPGTDDEPAISERKTISISKLGMFTVDEHGMRVPKLRPMGVNISVTLTRRLHDCSITDIGVDIVMPTALSLVKPGLPTPARVNVHVSTADGSFLSRHDKDAWFKHAEQAAHAAAMWSILHNWLADGDDAQWIKLFGELDVDHSGELDYGEMRSLLDSNDIILTDDEFQVFVHSIDTDNNGVISIQEFKDSIRTIKAAPKQ
jgi:hypothetical protein